MDFVGNVVMMDVVTSLTDRCVFSDGWVVFELPFAESLGNHFWVVVSLGSRFSASVCACLFCSVSVGSIFDGCCMVVGWMVGV